MNNKCKSCAAEHEDECGAFCEFLGKRLDGGSEEPPCHLNK